MESTKTYWKGLEELNNHPEFIKNSIKEFPEFSSKELNVNSDSIAEEGSNRRDFLKFLGFSVAAASLAACETPVKKAIPYLIKPEDVDPTNANWYASSYVDGGDYASVVVKTREGRPIKIEGNKKSTVSAGATGVRAQASVLGLYDGSRLRSFQEKGAEISFEAADKKIISKLQEVVAAGKAIYVVTSTVCSPSLNAAISAFAAKYSAKVVAVDPVSAYGISKANELSFGSAFIPSYDFSKAKTIVSIGADFLGTWLSSSEYAKQYSKTRKISEKNPAMSKHFQFESIMSLAGANADYRTMIKPSQEGLVVSNLYNLVAGKLGAASISTTQLSDLPNLKLAAENLVKTKGYSLVVSGSNDPAVQILVNAINNLLASYGSTIDTSRKSNVKLGNDAAFAHFVSKVKDGSVGAVLFYNSNPVYASALGKELASSLSKVALKVSFSDRVDETSSLCDFITPDHHYLESWSDAEPKTGSYSLIQPTITPLFKARAAVESFTAWTGSPVDSYTYLTNFWKSNLFPKQSKYTSFQAFWDKSLYDGVFELPASSSTLSFSGDVSSAASAVSKRYKAKSEGFELVVYEKVGMGHGSNGLANNPWILEFPDPITKATWENYLTIPISLAKKLSIKMEFGNTQRVTLKANGVSLTVPVLVQPGQAPDTVGIAVGFGREKVGKAGNGLGVNAYPLISVANGFANYAISSGVEVSTTGETYKIAQTQTHQTIMGRDIVQESTLTEYKKNPAAGRYFPTIATADGVVPTTDLSMWKMRERTNHSWGMVIDLNACTGCGNCVVSCQAENNVPVVGKQEILNSREMHWIRIDRYYTSDMTHEKAEENKIGAIDMYRNMEDPSENPKVVFQPMMCQHCNNAPCETVCPVAATTHSSEGLNQMTYNRCIGTRYCANNCPYKVRRFNWFRYAENEVFNFNEDLDLGKMVLNPDVTVRARGVMEKCSLCVQRIQEGKLNAKKNNRRPVDGEIETACSQSCPSEAIVFGDMNDKDSKIYQLMEQEYNKRMYHVLEEINVRPNVSYLTKIRNTEA
ncbi:MAG TPA: molybdopterin oxidoreductase [Cytophagales bacterium]|nr:molybdopterin oxidoreductase [Cytophagales bacterium]